MTVLTPLSTLCAGLPAECGDSSGIQAALRCDAMRQAAQIRDHGGDRWLVLSEDPYELAVGVLAALHAGAIAVLPANHQPGHLQALSQGIAGVLCGRGKPADGAKPVLAISDTGLDTSATPLDPLDPHRALIRLHTSGTTGAPVAVDKPLRCIEAELSALATAFAHLPFHTVLATVPPFHIYGLLFRVFWPLATARPFIRHTIRFPGELLSTLEAADRPLLVSSPAFLKRVLHHVDLDFLGERLCGLFSSGGPLPPETAAAYNKALRHPVIEVYGSTETGGIGHRTVLDADAPPAWTPLPGVDVACDPELGVLSVASPFIADGGRYRTADVAEMRSNGQFVLHGRADRIVKLEERRVSLRELEQRLAGSPEVAAVRVLPVGEADQGRAVLGAVVVPSAVGWQLLREGGKAALKQRLLAALRPHVDMVTLPRKWRVVRHLPETTQGKIREDELRQLFTAARDDVTPVLLDRSADEGKVRITLRPQAELLYFDGHFDVAPVLAGVVQLDWAIAFGKEHFPISKPFRRIEALKFFNIIPAERQVVLDLSYDADAGRLHFRYGAEGRDYSSGRITFGAAP